MIWSECMCGFNLHEYTFDACLMHVCNDSKETLFAHEKSYFCTLIPNFINLLNLKNGYETLSVCH